jgi:hypothetical protein
MDLEHLFDAQWRWLDGARQQAGGRNGMPGCRRTAR